MIVTYIQARPNGEIIGSGVIQEEVLDTVQPIEDASIIVGVYADPSALVYFDGTSIVDMPPKPSGEYKFNYTTKEWEFDRAVAEANALAKRDKLLADGPDRISPLWWSTMTEQEQQSWTKYRQDLLDITTQQGYPESIIWPTKP